MSKRGSQSFLYSMPKHAKLKLNNNVDINVCEVNGVSTLYLSINSNQNGHNSTVHFFRNEERKNMSSRQSL